MKRIAVIGGAGYIGSHVVQALSQQGYTPVVYDDLSSGHADAVGDAPLIVGDLADTEKLGHTLEQYAIEAVMNFAGLIAVGESVQNPARYYDINVRRTLTLLDTLRSHRIRAFIFSSTCAIYGLPQQLPLTEAHPYGPVNPYGRTKLAIEFALDDYAAAYPDFHYVSLRYFNACGADPEARIGERHEPETHLIPLVLEAAAGQRPAIHIHGTDYPTPDGTCIRDYIHVCDLAEAHLLALKYLQQHQQSNVFNLGNGQGYSVREIIAAAEQVTGRAIPVIEAPRRSGDPPVLVGCSQKAKDLLGWQPTQADLATILGTAWRWQQHLAQINS